MAHNYTPTAVYHTTYPVPDDGDPAIANSVNSPLEDLADGLAYGVGPMAQGGTIILGGELEFTNGLVTISGGLDVRTVGATFHSDVVFNEDVTLGSSAADTLTVNARALLNDDLVVGNAASASLFRGVVTFSNDVTFSETLSAAGSLEVTGTFECTGAATFEGDVQIGSTGSADSLNVYANTLFHRDVTIGDDSGSETFTVNSSAIFQDTVELNGTVQLDGDININGDVICGGSATFTDDVTLGNGSGDAINILGSTTITNLVSPMGFSGDGRILLRINNGPNATATIDLDDQDILHVPTLTTDRTYNVSFSGAVEGSACWIHKPAGTGGDLEINWTGGTSTFLAAQAVAILFVYHSGAIIAFPRLDN